MKGSNAKRISFSIVGITNEEVMKLINKLSKEFGDKLYFANWGDCKIVEKK